MDSGTALLYLSAWLAVVVGLTQITMQLLGSLRVNLSPLVPAFGFVFGALVSAASLGPVQVLGIWPPFAAAFGDAAAASAVTWASFLWLEAHRQP